MEKAELEKKKAGTDIVAFSPIEKSLVELKNKYKEVPDCTTKKGMEAVKLNLKEYRTIKKKVEDTRKSENEGLVARKKAIDSLAKEIMKTVEDVFTPHKEAKTKEDERSAEEKRLKVEVEEKRLRDIKNSIESIKNLYIEAISMGSESVKAQIHLLDANEITKEFYSEFMPEAEAIKTAILGKLKELYLTKKEQEGAAERLAKAEAELKEREEKQRLEDEARAAKQKAEEDERQAAIEKENAEMKAKLAEMEAKQKQIDDANELIAAEKRRLKEDEDRREREEAARIETEERLKVEKEKEEREAAEAKKAREKAEKQAKKEAVKRRDELSNALCRHVVHPDFNLVLAEAFIEGVEAGVYPYLKLDWTQK